MAKVVGAFDVNDWREYVKRGAVLYCDGGRGLRNILLPVHCGKSVQVEHAGQVPAGWVILRECFEEGCMLSFYCPDCDPVYGS